MSATMRMTEEQLAERTTRMHAPQQQRLPVTGRERKDTMTIAELRGQQPERDIRAEVLSACLAYKHVAWMTRCETYRGYVLPMGMLKAFSGRLHARETWTAKAVLQELHKVLAWREFAAAGMADLIGQLRPVNAGGVGTVVAFEVKKVGLKADAHQQAFLDLVTRAGGCAAVVHNASDAIDCIAAFCKARGRHDTR